MSMISNVSASTMRMASEASSRIARKRARSALSRARSRRPGGRACGQADERARNGARVDVDVPGERGARDHEEDGEHAEEATVGQHVPPPLAGLPGREPLVGVRIEEDAEHDDPGCFDDVVQVEGAVYSTSSTISISTGMPIGSSAMPTAERACLPIASPKTSTIRSEKPLITFGWSPKPSAEFTMPRTFTTRLTLSRLPSEARVVASRLSPTSLATW